MRSFKQLTDKQQTGFSDQEEYLQKKDFKELYKTLAVQLYTFVIINS